MGQILCVHGVNTDERDPKWQENWKMVLGRKPRFAAKECCFLEFNKVFEDHPAKGSEYLTALGQLLKGLYQKHKVLGFLSTGKLGLLESKGSALRDMIDMTAGMVVNWTVKEEVRSQTRDLLASKIKSVKPEYILAHSLGGLIVYDTFRVFPELAKDVKLYTFGSQIGFDAIEGKFWGGDVKMIETLASWVHLYNPNDLVFTASLLKNSCARSQRFVEKNTPFVYEKISHEATKYLEKIS